MKFAVAIAVPIPAGAPFGRDAFPHLAYAVQTVAASGMKQWLQYAKGESLPDGSTIGSRTGQYANSIQLEQTGAFAWRIFSDAPHAEAIENGTPARDLKKMLDSSFKVRRRANGQRYLIIPFRWGTPGTVTFGANVMPASVHEFWQQNGIRRSYHLPANPPTRVSQTGAMDVKTRQSYLVPAYDYHWGSRLTQRVLSGMGIGTTFKGRQYKTHPMAGMVNFRNSGGRGGGQHSSYLTFRVMQEGQPGWLAPAIPGKHPAAVVAEKLERVAEQAFAAAVERDMKTYLGVR